MNSMKFNKQISRERVAYKCVINSLLCFRPKIMLRRQMPESPPNLTFTSTQRGDGGFSKRRSGGTRRGLWVGLLWKPQQGNGDSRQLSTGTQGPEIQK